MLQQVIRNVKGYFRNKSAFICSFISMFVLIMIYLMFMLKFTVDKVAYHFADVALPEKARNTPAIVSAWLMGGMLVVNAINATMGSLSIIIADEEQLKTKDFTISPFSPWKQTLSYIISAFVAGMIVCILSLIVVLVFVGIVGKSYLSFLAYLKMLPIIALTVLLTAAIITFLYSRIKHQTSLVVINTIAGSIIGFLVGAYIPMGELPAAIQGIMKFLPFTYATSFLRAIMVKDITGGVVTEASFGDFSKHMGNQIYIGSYPVPPWLSVLIALGATVIFFGLTVLSVYYKKRKN